MNERFPLGLVPVDENDHMVAGRYRSHVSEDDPSAIEVIEIANARLAHTRVDGGNPEGRRAVFSRLISQYELDLRILHHAVNPEEYRQHIIEDLSK